MIRFLSIFVFFSFANTVTAQKDANYQRNDEETHFLLLIMPDRKGDLNDVRTEATKYVWNTDNQRDWKLTHLLIGPSTQTNALLIKSFENGAEAYSFFEKMKEDRPDFLHTGLTEKAWIIGESNYNELIRSKNIAQYDRFFYFNYLLENQ